MKFPTWALAILMGASACCSSAIAQGEATFTDLRHRMVKEEIEAAGVENERVLQSMRNTPRHQFVNIRQRQHAYFDMALPIGERQTISPPFVVAFMTEQLDPQPEDKVLEIGTGSGYQAAVLSPLVKQVYTIEIVESLGRRAKRTLDRLDYDNVHVKIGDGYQGWPEHAPFDKIIVTCSPEKVPRPLVEQLKEGGKMVIPVGERYQQTLYLLTKQEGELSAATLRPTLFVPMTGRAEQRRERLPDPTQPEIHNGSFEQLVGEGKKPAGWHYQRQLQVVEDELQSRDGNHYVVFSNDVPGKGARALQGFAVDGRKVPAIEIALWVRGKNLRYGQDRRQWPRLIVTLFDESRAQIGVATVGPWTGTFDWTEYRKRFPVPLAAREAIIHVGLLGGIGELAIDEVRIGRVDE